MHVSQLEIFSKLQVIGNQGENLLNIGEAALLLANLDLPENDPKKYLRQLSSIASDLTLMSQGAETLQDRIKALANTLYKQHGFQGDNKNYDDPQNTNLMKVIDRHKGIPVSLGILAIHVCRAQGWQISGVNFPGHFLLRISSNDEHCLIDPFRNADFVSTIDLQSIFRNLHGQEMPHPSYITQPMCDRDILVRLQNNIKIRALGNKNSDRAIQILKSIVLMTPTSFEFLSELAILEASGGKLKSAIQRLDEFMERYPGTRQASNIRIMKEKLNRTLN